VSNALSHRAFFLAGDWADALAGKFDLVLSNPPYIPSADIAGLMPEVACHEPPAALDGGADGLDAYRRLVAILPALLAPGGAAILELGMGQLAAVRALAEQAELHYLGAEADLAGIARAIKLCRRADAGFWAKKLFGSTAMGS
jgi:release factor glutamine methyltransferase